MIAVGEVFFEKFYKIPLAFAAYVMYTLSVADVWFCLIYFWLSRQTKEVCLHMKKRRDKISETDKITIWEYEEKYSSKTDQKKAAGFFSIVVCAIGALILACAFSLFKDIYEVNKYAGYAVGVILIVLIIVFFVVPVVKIRRKDRFLVDVTAYNAIKAKKHNAALRKALADKIVECYVATTDGSCWYSGERVRILIEAKNSDDNAAIRSALDDIYKKDVKKAVRNIITRCAVKSGAYSAISQQNTVDALLVTAINLQMIKDIVFIYGFRPSESHLLSIFGKVLSNSFVAYGLGNVKVGNTVVKTMGDVVRAIPILGTAISTIVDSTVQGLGNATLTAIIGHNTVRYLMKEYRLQNILDDAEINFTEEDFDETCNEVKKELTVRSASKNKAV